MSDAKCENFGETYLGTRSAIHVSIFRDHRDLRVCMHGNTGGSQANRVTSSPNIKDTVRDRQSHEQETYTRFETSRPSVPNGRTTGSWCQYLVVHEKIASRFISPAKKA